MFGGPGSGFLLWAGNVFVCGTGSYLLIQIQFGPAQYVMLSVFIKLYIYYYYYYCYYFIIIKIQ